MQRYSNHESTLKSSVIVGPKSLVKATTSRPKQDRISFSSEQPNSLSPQQNQQQPLLSEKMRKHLHAKVIKIKWRTSSKKALKTMKAKRATFRRPRSPILAQEYPAEPQVPHRVQSMPNLTGGRTTPTQVELIVVINENRRLGAQFV